MYEFAPHLLLLFIGIIVAFFVFAMELFIEYYYGDSRIKSTKITNQLAIWEKIVNEKSYSWPTSF